VWCVDGRGRGAYHLASPGNIECQTYQLQVNKLTQEKKSDLHLLRIVKIVLILLLQGGIQPVLRTKVRYAAGDTLAGFELE
jgi:hypothetical protein